MAAKYFTQFVTGAAEARHASGWSGVVEVAEPLEGRKGAQRARSQVPVANRAVQRKFQPTGKTE